MSITFALYVRISFVLFTDPLKSNQNSKVGKKNLIRYGFQLISKLDMLEGICGSMAKILSKVRVRI
jgi:hypothetical protein